MKHVLGFSAFLFIVLAVSAVATAVSWITQIRFEPVINLGTTAVGMGAVTVISFLLHRWVVVPHRQALKALDQIEDKADKRHREILRELHTLADMVRQWLPPETRG